MGPITQTVVVFVLFTGCWSPSAAFGVSIAENGYRDIRVSLPRSAPSGIRKQLIQTTKELFNSSSLALFAATKRRAYFRSVTFIVPLSWDDEEGWLDEDNVTVYRNHWDVLEEADIVVADAVPGSKPYTLHGEGCRGKGVRIYLPQNFLLSELNQVAKDRYFLHQWAKFRYGVFEEGGFEADERFPLYYSIPGSTEVLVTSCGDAPLKYNFMNEGGENCQPEVDLETGRPSGEKCSYNPIPENAILQSSLMYQQGLPWAHQFCEGDLSLDKGHDPATPSKHNALCNEEGTWFVILRSPDFLNGRNQARRDDPSPVRFRYVQESTAKVIVALEVSKHMQDHNRYRQVKNALAKFVLFDLPTYTQFGVIYYSDGVVPLDFPYTVTDRETRNSFLESLNIPDEPTSSDVSCPVCALNTSIQMLKSESSSEGGIVLLVTTGICEAGAEDSLKKKLVDRGVRLFVILFHRGTPENCYWESMTSASGGLVFHIAESSSSWTALEQLYQSFASVVKGRPWTPQEHVLIAREHLNSQEDVFLQISVDKFVGEELRIFITGDDFNILNAPLLADYTRIIIGDDVATEFRRQPFMPAWIFEINRQGAGVITLISKRNEKNPAPILVMVTGRSGSDMATISATAWFEKSNQQLITSDYLPVKLYSEIRSGNNPVTEANVEALVFHPDGVLRSAVNLHDNGAGDPDVTRYDGIYSAYFSNYTSAGYYTIMLKVSSNETQVKIRRVDTENCCGSFMPYSGAESTGYFVRYIGPLSFLRTNEPPREDKYPPNRILDLQILNFDGEQMKCTLRWTAAGENFTEGMASRYQIKIFVDRTDLRRNFADMGVQIEEPRDVNWTSTGPYGTLVQCDIFLPEVTEYDYYYIAVQATDKANNTGQVSNTVQIYVGDQKTYKTPNCEDIDTRRNNSGTWNCGNFIVCITMFLLFLVATHH